MKLILFLAATIAATVAFATTTIPTGIPAATVPSAFRATAISKINSLVTAVNEMQSGAADPSADGVSHSRILRTHYNLATSGSVGDHDTSGTLPSGALVIRSYSYIDTIPTTVGGLSGTVAFYCGSGGNLMAATGVSGSAVGTLIEGMSTGAASAYKKMSGACTVQAAVGAAAFTAGKLTLWVEYVINN